MLEVLAYIWMTFNHITYLLPGGPIYFIKYFPVVPVIFALLVVNGFHKTGNLAKYKNRIALIAILAQPLNSYLFGGGELNIVFSLLILVYALEVLAENNQYKNGAVFFLLVVMVFVRIADGFFFVIIFGLIFEKLFSRIEGILNKLQNRFLNKKFLRNYYLMHLIVLAIIKFIMEGGYI